jgi:hypothetical protein
VCPRRVTVGVGRSVAVWVMAMEIAGGVFLLLHIEERAHAVVPRKENSARTHMGHGSLASMAG